MAPETISISFEKTTCSARKVVNTCVILESLESNRAQTTFFAPRLQSVGNYSLIMYHRVVIHKNIKWLWSPLITKAGQISPVCILTTPFDCNWQTSLVLWMFYALSVSRYNHSTYVLIHSTWKDSMFVFCLHCFWFEMNSEKIVKMEQQANFSCLASLVRSLIAVLQFPSVPQLTSPQTKNCLPIIWDFKSSP